MKRAAEVLVKAAQGSAVFQEEEEEFSLNAYGGGFKEELEIQEIILRKQKELEKARVKLTLIRKERYRDDESDDESK